MKIKYVEVQVGLTKNLGNYESARLAYTLGADLDEGEGAMEAKQIIRDKLIAEVNGDLPKLTPVVAPKNFK